MNKFYVHLSALLILISFSHATQTYAANNPAYEARRQTYLDTALVRGGQNALSVQAYRGVQVDTAIIRSTIASFVTSGTNDFRYEILVRVLCESPGTYDSLILPALLPVKYWINYNDTLDCFWSENHIAQWMSSHWIMHERYGVPADSNLRKRIIYYLQSKLQYNYYEFFSTTYNPFCLSGLLNLADFSQDTVIKNLATQASLLLMKDMLVVMNDRGVLFPTAGRNYPASYENPYGQDISSLLWMLTGRGQMPGGPSHSGCFLATSSIFIDSVAQSWMPMLDTTFIMGAQTMDQAYASNAAALDSIDRIVFQWSAGAYFNPQYALESFNLITDSSLWNNSVFLYLHPLSGLPASAIPSISQSLYAISSSTVMYSDTIVVYKHNAVTLSSVQDYWPGYWGYQQYPCVANIATTAVYTASGIVDSIWDNRSHNNENDDLPYVKQLKNVALEMYWPLPKSTLVTQSIPTVALHWKDADFTEVRNDNLWLLGRVSDSYVAVKRSCTGMMGGLRACDPAQHPGQGWVIVVGDSAMYGSFDHFQAVIDSSLYTEQWHYDSASRQRIFFAQIIIDGDTVNHTWSRLDTATATGISDIAANPANALSLYPNPTNTILNLTMGEAPVNGTIEIYSIVGETIYRSNITSQTMTISTDQWRDGIYAMRLSSDSGTMSRCFVVSH